jgi:hypothetical protein
MRARSGDEASGGPLIFLEKWWTLSTYGHFAPLAWELVVALTVSSIYAME